MASPGSEVHDAGLVNAVLLLRRLLPQHLQPRHHLGADLLHPLDVVICLEHRLGGDDVLDLVKVFLEVQSAPDLDVPGLAHEVLDLPDLTEQILLVRVPALVPAEVVLRAVAPLAHVIQRLKCVHGYKSSGLFRNPE